MRQQATTERSVVLGMIWYDGEAGERRKGVEDGSRTQREMWNEQLEKNKTAQSNAQAQMSRRRGADGG